MEEAGVLEGCPKRMGSLLYALASKANLPIHFLLLIRIFLVPTKSFETQKSRVDVHSTRTDQSKSSKTEFYDSLIGFRAMLNWMVG